MRDIEIFEACVRRVAKMAREVMSEDTATIALFEELALEISISRHKIETTDHPATKRSGERLAKDGMVHIADNERQRWAKRILAFIREKGIASRRDIQRKINSGLKGSELDEHLKDLCDSGRIEKIDGEQERGKRSFSFQYIDEQ